MTLMDLVCGMGLAAAVAVLLMRLEYRGFPSYAVGDIAREDIRASTDFTVEDRTATQLKARQAGEESPTVFDYDSNLVGTLERQIRGLFERGRALAREVRGSSQRRLRPTQRAELLAKLGQEGALSVPQVTLQALVSREFSADLEEQLIGLIRRVYQGGIASSRDLLLKAQARGILLRDIASGGERLVSDVFSIKDLGQARVTVRDRIYELGVSPSERRALQPYLEQLLSPDITFNRAETLARQGAAAGNVDPVVIQVKKGKVIVRQGDEITDPILVQLEALRRHQRAPNTGVQFAGFFLLAATFLYLLWRYLALYPSRQISIRNQYLLVSLVLIVNLAVVRFFLFLLDGIASGSARPFLQVAEHLYPAVPFAFGAILTTLLTTVHVAILFSLTLSLLVGALTGQVPLTVYCLVGCFAALYGIHHYRERSIMLKAGLLVGSVNVVTMVTLDLVSLQPSPGSFLAWKMVPSFSGGIVAAMMAAPILPLLETLFHVTTDIRLLELSNLDTPILRQLAVEAPGTYHHSIVVGTLAEAAAKAIGANPLLARVGAYYHDIGKMLKPEYYVENQLHGDNKHEQLSPRLSRLIILNHVKGGLQMAREMGLAPPIRDMIPQHHGTRLMTYFYEKEREQATGQGEVSENDFRYLGPKPQSKEAAILMLADGVEAASRTLKEPTPAQLNTVARKIATAVITDGQLDECDITLREVDLIRESFLKVLMGIFHHRIAYPGYDFGKIEKADQGSPVH
ncbi:MAG: HDIG domain-containing protein [Acidobacteria bacterium]|nr:HDIG domain-containing protein [Acidobacteriota bacterium]